MLGISTRRNRWIYFASGLRLNGMDNQAQLHATINAAIRAGVSFWPIDARGLVAEAPLGDATQGFARRHRHVYRHFGAWPRPSNFQQSQDTLCALAADTGGKALLDNNDLTAGIVQAQKAVSSYYIIGYYTTNAALDGKFRADQDLAQQRSSPPSLDYPARLFRRQDSSANSPRPIKNASWKMR